MKTIQLKITLITILTLILNSSIVKAANIGTMIDVLGGAYYDRAWVFAVNGTTTGFDNGWDGYKFLASSTIAPQIYVPGTDGGTFQIAVVPDLNETPVNFIPGESIEYTLLFTHTNISLIYKELYLVDNIANKKVDIYADGSKYIFNSTVGDIKERFKLIAVTYPQADTVIVTNPTEPQDTTDTTTTEPQDTTVVTPPTDTQDTTVVTPPTDPKDSTVVTPPADDKTKGWNKKHKKVAVYCVGNKVIIDNANNENADISFIDITTGKKVKHAKINGKNKTTIETNLRKGIYIVNTIFRSIADNSQIIIR